MSHWVALFRGINVGGHNRLPMKSLVAILEGLGCTDVKTYIQSGNAVFSSPQSGPDLLPDEIRHSVKSEHGFEPMVLLLSASALVRARDANPFPEGEAEPKSLHLFFLATKPTDIDEGKLEALQNETERYALLDDVFYLYAPDGIGRSKLAASVERCLGVPVTARNWRTVNKMLALANQT
ncbi:MAG: DUF1697 domain-containing protein [Woeseia sp.]|mgnify:CR=1 FL=1|nr:DUF1697 domain-containing protein [Woeseia sp.]MBT6210262.1 DUF1697 domain-containing protein [Woeseia sp.]